MAASAAAPPTLVVFGAPARCRGVRRDGKPCQWNAASNCTVAAPLQSGYGYCTWHLPQDDCRQQRLDKFLVRAGIQTERRLEAEEDEEGMQATQQKLPNQLARSLPTPARSQGTMQLTREQCDRISERRRKALERRQQRQADNCQVGEHSLALSQCLQGEALVPIAGATVHLTQEQHARIARNRALAIERQHRRHLESEDVEVAVGIGNAVHSSTNSVPSSGSCHLFSSSVAPSSETPSTELLLASQQSQPERLHGEQQPEQKLKNKLEEKLERKLEPKLEQGCKQKLEQQLKQQFEQQHEQQHEQQKEQPCIYRHRSRSPCTGARSRVGDGKTPPQRRRRLVACITGSPPPQVERSSRALQQASRTGLCTGAGDGAALATKCGAG